MTEANGRCPSCARIMLVQKYYPVSEAAWLFGFSDTTIKDWIKKGKFGPEKDFLEVSGEKRIPASGMFFFINNHLKDCNQAKKLADQVKGRTLGEARRRFLEQGSPNV